MNGPDDRQPPAECDLVVVGGGIVGLAVARELLIRHPDARLCVLEAEQRIGEHQTGRSSGVIHAGIYYRPGSLKARLCVEGANELYEYCDEHGIAYTKAGKLIVATGEDELTGLDELERRGAANGVEGLRRLGSDEIREVEPEAAGVAALHSPNTGLVDFVAVAESYAAGVARAGGTVHLGAGVAGSITSPERFACTMGREVREQRRRSSVPDSGPIASRLPAVPRSTLESFRSAVATWRSPVGRPPRCGATSTPCRTPTCPSSART